MKITWFSFGSLQSDGQRWSSPLASTRYRVIIPAQELIRRGHQVDVVFVPPEADISKISPFLAADAVIFSKSTNPLHEALAGMAQQAGSRVFLDICDHYFDSPKHGAHFRKMLALADQLVVNTPAMAALILRESGRSAAVISDPYEGERGAPRFAPAPDLLRLLWFGHPLNFDALQGMVPDLLPLSRELALELHIVSAPLLDIEQACASFNRQHSARYRLRFTPWSMENTWQALRETDLVVIPSLDNDKKTVKSPNRLVETLWAGRYAVAQPVPSYQPFAEWVWLDTDLVAGIRQSLQDVQGVLKRIEQAQAFVAANFSPAIIAQQWEALLATS